MVDIGIPPVSGLCPWCCRGQILWRSVEDLDGYRYEAWECEKCGVCEDAPKLAPIGVLERRQVEAETWAVRGGQRRLNKSGWGDLRHGAYRDRENAGRAKRYIHHWQHWPMNTHNVNLMLADELSVHLLARMYESEFGQ